MASPLGVSPPAGRRCRRGYRLKCHPYGNDTMLLTPDNGSRGYSDARDTHCKRECALVGYDPSAVHGIGKAALPLCELLLSPAGSPLRRDRGLLVRYIHTALGPQPLRNDNQAPSIPVAPD
jgi:hypothetical protein